MLTEALKRHLELWEGRRNTRYICPAGYPTIGVGHKIRPGENFTEPMAEIDIDKLLREDVKEAAQEVEKLVKVPLTQGQLDALIDFVFNLGSGNLASSTLLKLLNEGKYQDAKLQLLRWNKARVNGVLQPLSGLTYRRQAAMFMWDN